MKSILKAVVALAIGVAMVACGGQAKAADAYDVYAGAGGIFSVKDVRKIELLGSGFLRVTYDNGQVSQGAVADSTGVLLNKIAKDHPEWILNGKTLWAVPKATFIDCAGGSRIYWYGVFADPEIAPDSCYVFYQAQIIAKNR